MNTETQSDVSSQEEAVVENSKYKTIQLKLIDGYKTIQVSEEEIAAVKKLCDSLTDINEQQTPKEEADYIRKTLPKVLKHLPAEELLEFVGEIRDLVKESSAKPTLFNKLDNLKVEIDSFFSMLTPHDQLDVSMDIKALLLKIEIQALKDLKGAYRG